MKTPAPSVIGATFLKGLVVVLPVAITAAIVYWLGASLEQVLGGLIRLLVTDEYYVPGAGIAAGVLLTFLAGVAMQVWITRRLLLLGEALLERIPLAKTIYGGVRDLVDFVSRTAESRDMDTVVLVPVGEGAKVVGFVTAADGEVVGAASADGEQRVPVYVPMSYQIGGFTVFVPRDRLEPLDMSIEEAMRWVLTAGISTRRRPRAQRRPAS